MALLLTVVCNVAGVFTMPFTLLWALGSSVSITPGDALPPLSVCPHAEGPEAPTALPVPSIPHSHHPLKAFDGTIAPEAISAYREGFVWTARVLGSTLRLDPSHALPSSVPLLQSLVQIIMVPLLLGSVARRLLPPLADFADQNKKAVSKMQSTLLIMVPWMQVSKSVSAFSSVG